MKTDEIKSMQEQIAKGSLIFALGLGAAVLLQFGVGVIIIRNISKAEFGLITLSMTILNFLSVLCCIGFNNGLPRIIAMYSEKKEIKHVNEVITHSFIIVFITSVVLSFLLYFCSNPIALFLGKPLLKKVLELFSLILFPMTMMLIFTAIFRGLEQTKPKVIFQDFALNLIRILILVPVIIIGWRFKAILWVYVISAWLAFFSYFKYTFKNILAEINFSPAKETAKELIWFSLPLLPIAILTNFVDWVGTLSLGYFHDADQVGVYSVARRLVSFMSIPLLATVFLYLPMTTKLKAAENEDGIKQLYANSTKWAFVFTMPLLLIFLFDGEFIITRLFGQSYAESVDILKILAVGFCIQNFVGPNGVTLIACAKTKDVLYGTIFSAVIVVVSCWFLVPHYGSIGSAICVALSIVASNLFISIKLYYLLGAHPFGSNNVKPILLTCVVSYFVFQGILTIDGWLYMKHFIGYVLIGGFSILSPFLTFSLDENEKKYFQLKIKKWGGRGI